jgi:phenylacetate-coenzyme A ligase PaaK-like adenylate-forming protein
VIHVLRELYERVPTGLRMPVAAFGRLLPVRMRYGQAFVNTRAMLESEGSNDLAAYTASRDMRLARLVAAGLDTTWWSRVFREAGLPAGPTGVDDLRELPFLTKEEVREHSAELLWAEVPEHARKWVTTGGTTGVPLGLWIEKDASAADWAFVVNAWGRVGFRLDEKRVVLRGRRLGGASGRALFEYEPVRRELYVSTFDMDERHLSSIRRKVGEFGAHYIHGYPSAMEVLGRSYQRAGETPPQVEALLAVSEVLYPAQRAELERYFSARVFSFYGMTEKVAFAAECEYSSDLHVDERYGIVELIDANGDVIEDAGVVGEIVATGLMSRAMPLFRYRTGDRAAWADGACECGRPMRRLASVEGRWHGKDALVGALGGIITMTALNVHSAVLDRVERFRFVQEQPGQALLLVVPAEGFEQSHKEAILAELSAKLAGQVDLTVEVVDELPLTAGGKFLFVDQRIKELPWT